VELLVATALMTIAVVGSVTLTQSSGLTSRAATARYRQQSLVDADVARIRRLNDRYTCFSGTCTSSGSTDPGKNGFFPTPPSTSPLACGTGTACSNFENLCRSTGLITQLVTEIGTTPTALSNAGVTYSIDTANQGQQTVSEFGTNVVRNLHRYTVTYTSSTSGEQLRKVTLVPTAAAWCP
jgi:hypothetical protein